MRVQDRERVLTVVHVRERDDIAEVMFVESARIYILPHARSGYRQVFDFLHQAAGTGKPVAVRFADASDEIIDSARDPD